MCVLGDWAREIDKKKLTFHLHAVLLQFFFIEWASKILPAEGKYVIWHTCPADDLERKTIWIPVNYLNTKLKVNNNKQLITYPFIDFYPFLLQFNN